MDYGLLVGLIVPRQNEQKKTKMQRTSVVNSMEERDRNQESNEGKGTGTEDENQESI